MNSPSITTWAVLLLAALAVALPWQRCHGDCHDTVRLPGGSDGCHDAGCPDESDSQHEDEDEHERILLAEAASFDPVDALPVGSDGFLAFAAPVPALSPVDVASTPTPPLIERAPAVLLL